MNLELNIDKEVFEGYEFTGEYRVPIAGEYVLLATTDGREGEIVRSEGVSGLRLIFRKTETFADRMNLSSKGTEGECILQKFNSDYFRFGPNHPLAIWRDGKWHNAEVRVKE
jgi:hypothetical protein